ncbi:uncharacterized protein [Procambarus clarkii]|uniref:uncharacterized protein isoform X2 n=1 Tax=Procambarus clarkii TaxID=6728 RepID=UPI0037443639
MDGYMVIYHPQDEYGVYYRLQDGYGVHYGQPNGFEDHYHLQDEYGAHHCPLYGNMFHFRPKDVCGDYHSAHRIGMGSIITNRKKIVSTTAHRMGLDSIAAHSMRIGSSTVHGMGICLTTADRMSISSTTAHRTGMESTTALMVGTCCWAQILVSPPSRSCDELEAMDESSRAVKQPPQYVAGEEMLVKAQVPHVEKGVFEFYLCPKTGPGDEDCLMRWPLEISGVEGRQYKMDKNTQGGEYNIPLIIPDHFTCDSCTLQWTVVTKQCAPEDGGDGAGSSCSNQRTTLCSDISIVERKFV